MIYVRLVFWRNVGEASRRFVSPTAPWRVAQGLDMQNMFTPLPLTKLALLITVRNLRSPKKPICYWLSEIVIVFAQNYVRFYVLSLEVWLGLPRQSVAPGVSRILPNERAVREPKTLWSVYGCVTFIFQKHLSSHFPLFLFHLWWHSSGF
jgi:hypothetical protein